MNDLESGLISSILIHLCDDDMRQLAWVSETATWLHELSLTVVEGYVRRQMEAPSLTRWSREAYHERRHRMLEGHHVRCSSQYFARVAGLYRLSQSTTLLISPSGTFVNEAPNSPRGLAPGTSHGHRFVGQASIAAVAPSPDSQMDYLYKLDRSYTECTAEGRAMTVEDLPFVGEAYRCFSVAGFRPETLELLENRPCPEKGGGWNLRPGVLSTDSTGQEVLLRFSEQGTVVVLGGDDEESDLEPIWDGGDGSSGLPLRVVGVQEQAWAQVPKAKKNSLLHAFDNSLLQQVAT